MKFLTLKFFIISCFLFTTSLSYSTEKVKMGNVIIHENPVKYYDIQFENFNNQVIKLDKFENKLTILNFWATWCLPCKEEMPYLDKLQSNKKLSNIKVVPINIGNEGKERAENFFTKLNIKNLEIFFDTSNTLAKKFMLRGLPTTVFINKNGEEFARVVGSYNFNNKKFISWLQKYN